MPSKKKPVAKKPDPPKKKKYIECPNCKGVYHVTTEDFNPKLIVHPGMLTLIQTYADLYWDQPPPDPSAGYGVLECPNCGSSIAPDGKFTIVEMTDSEISAFVSAQL